MSAFSLYKKHSKQELIELDMQVAADPANKNADGGIFLHTVAARKLLSDIARAIAWHMEDDRQKAGIPVPCTGYSGRKSNK